MEMRKVADGLSKLRERDQSAGDESAVQASRDIQLEMARQLREGSFIVDTIVAMVGRFKLLANIQRMESACLI